MGVTLEDLMNTITKILEKQEVLAKEVEELRLKNKNITKDHKTAILHAMSPKEREEFDKADLLSSNLMEQCITSIIQDGQLNPHVRGSRRRR